jgi:putative phosphoribosyl transferase
VSAGKSIPARPNLEQYRKQAKELVKARARRQPEALERIRRHHPRLRELSEPELWAAAFTLSDAQLVLAREHACRTWSEFVRHLSSVQPPGPKRYSARIDADGIALEAQIAGWRNASALVLLTQVSGSRSLASTRFMASGFNRAGLYTVVSDLLTEEEELQDAESQVLRHDLRLLARRIGAITNWIAREPTLGGLNIGCLSSGTGAAAALLDAAERPTAIRAIVSSGGRPDLAGPWLWRVRAPTLFLAGTRDSATILTFTGSALKAMAPDVGHSLELLEGESRTFGDNPLREKVTSLAIGWFCRSLTPAGWRP